MNTKTEKIQNVLGKIKECITEGRYILTVHALDRQNERSITLPATLHVLKTGYEEKKKSCYDTRTNTWKYAIRGKTLSDKPDIRVIIAFAKGHDEMVIITVMYVEEVL